jgi:hypothetical protein
MEVLRNRAVGSQHIVATDFNPLEIGTIHIKLILNQKKY